MRYKQRFDGKLPNNALRHVLMALIPYTEANLKLAFKPNEFFNDLDRIDRAEKRYARSSLRSAYYQAISQGYLEILDGQPFLTDKGTESLAPYQPKQLENSCILVIFDIPETKRHKRQIFRRLLRELKFQQVQKSVWKCGFECRDILAAEITYLRIEPHVEIFEAVEIST